jgi:hypothetical protein
MASVGSPSSGSPIQLGHESPGRRVDLLGRRAAPEGDAAPRVLEGQDDRDEIRYTTNSASQPGRDREPKLHRRLISSPNGARSFPRRWPGKASVSSTIHIGWAGRARVNCPPDAALSGPG